jgi:hypothetical protein
MQCSSNSPIGQFEEPSHTSLFLPENLRARLRRVPEYSDSDALPEPSTRFKLLSPLMFDHINFLGRYAFALPDSVAQGQLRPLRSAE